MTSVWKRAWAIANTPLDGRRVRRLLADLITPGKTLGVLSIPWRQHWAYIKFDQPSELTATVPRSLPTEALAWLKAEQPDPEGFNAWRDTLGRRPLFLAKVDLRNRDLRGYDLSGCILYGADLRGADLRGCKLNGAVLKSARISGASTDAETLAGHDLEELADGFETLEFAKYVRSLDPRKRGHLMSVTEADRKFKHRKQTMICALKFRSNIRNPLKLRAWLDNGVRSEQVSEFLLEPNGSYTLRITVERKHYPPDYPLQLTIFLDGLGEPLSKYQFWAWER